ncbi:hypothetical protein AcW2_000987 [Taiwanofungus camphoratus]|nr:hypothetical protein AcW2_000987 [Antrodia cinnamomea]
MQPPRVDLLHRALFDATSNISYPHESAVMTSNTSNIVFDDIFTISAIDKEGKKFDRVSRLYAHSKNYDMDLTLDYNVELYPLQKDQSFALALASSLAWGPPGAAGGAADEDDKDRDVWRPDGKGRRGLEEDYDYVMYGKVSAPSLTRCPRGCPSLWLLPYIACYSHSCAIEGIQIRRRHSGNCDGICIVWWAADVAHRVIPTYDKYSTRRSRVYTSAQVICYILLFIDIHPFCDLVAEPLVATFSFFDPTRCIPPVYRGR